jgi:nicotinate-nucleotide adenylyltransferase
VTQPVSKRAPEPGSNWGLLGGAFDPVHLGHLALAGDMTAKCRLTGIFFVPSFNPPHRKEPCVVDFPQRVKMLELALAPYPEYSVSTVEAELEGVSYTLHVVREMKRRFPQVEFHLILGADNLVKLSGWYRPEELVQEVDLLVGARPGVHLNGDYGVPADRLTCVTASLVDVASSDVRNIIAAGASVGQLTRLVPRAVAEEIVTHGWYR